MHSVKSCKNKRDGIPWVGNVVSLYICRKLCKVWFVGGESIVFGFMKRNCLPLPQFWGYKVSLGYINKFELSKTKYAMTHVNFQTNCAVHKGKHGI